MNPSPASPKIPLDDDALLARALDAFRADAARLPADGLAARVLAGVRRGDADERRFERVARVYAAAAAVLLVVGVGGSLAVRRSVPASARVAPRLDDLEAARLAQELAVTIDDQRVGGK